MQNKISFIFMLFNLHKMNTTSSDKDKLFEIYSQEFKMLTEKNKIEHLTREIDRFISKFFYSFDLYGRFVNSHGQPINKLDMVMHTDICEKWISSLIKKHLKNKNLLYYKISFDRKAKPLKDVQQCSSKNHKYYNDISLIQKIAKNHFDKNHAMFQIFTSETDGLLIRGKFTEKFIEALKMMTKDEFYKILISADYKNYCISCMTDHSNKKELKPVRPRILKKK